MRTEFISYYHLKIHDNVYETLISKLFFYYFYINNISFITIINIKIPAEEKLLFF